MIYIRERKKEVGGLLHVHNRMVMQKICEGGNKSGLYGHMKMLIDKGNETLYSNVKLINEDGETLAYENKVMDMIENFWVIFLLVWKGMQHMVLRKSS